MAAAAPADGAPADEATTSAPGADTESAAAPGAAASGGAGKATGKGGYAAAPLPVAPAAPTPAATETPATPANQDGTAAADGNVATLLAAAAEVAATGAPAPPAETSAPAAKPEAVPAATAFRSAAEQAAKMLEEQEKPPPPEDLALRERLEAFTEAQGKNTARAGYNNVLKILRRLQQDPKNAKLHEMRQDVLERALGKDLFFALEAAGFTSREAQATTAAAFVWQSQESETCLASTLHEVQRASDLCLDPDKVSFAEVSEMVAQGRTLPGIADVNDKVVTPLQPKASKLERPRKPWER